MASGVVHGQTGLVRHAATPSSCQDCFRNAGALSYNRNYTLQAVQPSYDRFHHVGPSISIAAPTVLADGRRKAIQPALQVSASQRSLQRRSAIPSARPLASSALPVAVIADEDSWSSRTSLHGEVVASIVPSSSPTGRLWQAQLDDLYGLAYPGNSESQHLLVPWHKFGFETLQSTREAPAIHDPPIRLTASSWKLPPVPAPRGAPPGFRFRSL
jgi:hypothetical protein